MIIRIERENFMNEEEKMLAGEIYDANYDEKLLEKNQSKRIM